jgi:hypothetical protein
MNAEPDKKPLRNEKRVAQMTAVGKPESIPDWIGRMPGAHATQRPKNDCSGISLSGVLVNPFASMLGQTTPLN